jgi:hypothetical protein
MLMKLDSTPRGRQAISVWRISAVIGEDASLRPR